MFDIAWSELFVIAVIALIFIGPKELPQVLNNLGRAAAKLRRSADEFRRHFEDSMRESGYEDVHKNLQDLRALNPSSQIRDTISRAMAQDHTAKPAPPQTEPLQSAASGNVSGGQEELAASTVGATASQGAESHTPAGEEAAPFEQWAPEPQKPAGEPAKDPAAPAA